MKRIAVITSALIFGGAALLTAQNAPASNNQVMGRGRGGAPYAWNDKNKDGICDVTGAPIGQGRGVCFMGRGGRGRGMAGGWGRGMGRGFWMQRQQQAAPAPAPAPAPAQK
jgi:hypothetical protein